MKDSVLKFYLNKYSCINNLNGIDYGFIPSVMRRRMSTLDKIALSNLNNVYSDGVRNIVFSSQYGEIERLVKLINQYSESKEVSPNTFSGSVHNFPIGFFLLNKKNSIPYTALSSCGNSISMGLLAAVLSNHKNVLFCYADSDNNHTNSIAVNIAKEKIAQSVEYSIKIETNDFTEDQFDDYVKLFNGEINTLRTPTYTIERMIKW